MKQNSETISFPDHDYLDDTITLTTSRQPQIDTRRATVTTLAIVVGLMILAAIVVLVVGPARGVVQSTGGMVQP